MAGKAIIAGIIEIERLRAIKDVWQLIETAPKGKIVALWVPEFDGFCAGAWFGMYSVVEEKWGVVTPLMDSYRRHITISELPAPTHWQSAPEAPEPYCNACYRPREEHLFTATSVTCPSGEEGA